MARSSGVPSAPSHGPGRGTALRLGLALAIAFVAVLVTILVPPLHLDTSPFIHSVRAAATPVSEVARPVASLGSSLSLGVSATPDTICAAGLDNCPAGTGISRVTLSADAETAPTPYWPNVQVAFVIETTAYDGFYYHYYGYPGKDKCALAGGGQDPPCEESNGGPFFIANAQQIANEISTANPHSKVSFAMVDFFGTDCGDWDDCGDSSKYDVDIPQFIPAASFGGAVQQSYSDGTFGGGFISIVGLDDNFLHSPSITALYGTIIGSGLDWSPNTHHVIVLIGSTAPRDPSYLENYAVSPFDTCCSGSQPDGWTCEPAYTFSDGVMPNCEGWVRSQNGNPNDSIAALAHTAPTCVDSVGHTCTIDDIDLWDTPDDPLSAGWPTGLGVAGSGPGGSVVVTNAQHVIDAGCDIAAATGGTWDGPSFASCPNGETGSLAYVPHGPVMTPNTNNPTLFAALRQVGFGPVYQTLVANGSDAPMFQYQPFGSVRVAPTPGFSASCQQPSGLPVPGCQHTPTVETVNGVDTLEWNFSTIRADNVLYVGDTWTASFNIVTAGPPLDVVPVDACIAPGCRAGGSTAESGFYTWAYYVPRANLSSVYQSFPLATIDVELTGTGAPAGVGPPPLPPAPPGIAVPVAPTVPVLSPVATTTTVGVANVSLNAAAAGFLGAGFVRVSMRNKPIAMQVAAMSTAKASSKFDKASREGGGPALGRFE
ncbi:MAG: hypothetical protein L3K16_05180 [Thermoplasmata archaeon]|nr:hypothetical protein [Thermoplasmata archaeon]